MGRYRQASVAGMFYDGEPRDLERDLRILLEKAEAVTLEGTIRGLVAPHAGYMYSGLPAATGYKALHGGSYDAVVIVGPSHREFFNGISVYPGDGYRTPLGEVPISDEVRSAILKHNGVVTASEAGHRAEHSIEVQLPFLQKVLGSFSFVPLVIGNQRRDLCFALAETLAAVARDRNILLVASSDLSHYHPYDTAVVLDRRVIRLIESFDENGLMTELEEGRAEACGGGPIVAVMNAARRLGASDARTLFYCNSGDVTGEKDAVVGYLSAAFLQTT